jgi:hypothetical protein
MEGRGGARIPIALVIGHCSSNKLNKRKRWAVLFDMDNITHSDPNLQNSPLNLK